MGTQVPAGTGFSVSDSRAGYYPVIFIAMEHSNGAEGQVKHITVGLILSWIVGVIFVIGGIGFMVTSLVSGILVFAAGLIMLPPVNDFLLKRSGIRLSGGVRFIIALILFGIGAAMVTGQAVDSAKQKVAEVQSTTPVTAASAPVASDEKLELVNYKCSVEYGYFKITGQVKNISTKPMENVMAVGSIFTASGEFVKSSDALIDYNPILVGQTSPFQTLTTTNPEATKCKVEFKEMFGGTISTKRSE